MDINDKPITFSIIIPVLDEATVIGGTLKRLAGLPGPREVIVVDGGSSDDTVGIASQHARVVSGSRGRASQMNVGAAIASGDLLLFLHADTVLPTGALNAIETAFLNPGVIGGRFRVKLDNSNWRYRMIGASINLRDRCLGGFTGDQAIFIYRETFRALGGFAEIPLMEDLDLGRRMKRYGKITRLPLYATTSARRWQKGGVVRTILLMWALRALYLLGCPPQRLTRFYREIR